jgi:Lon protease-like protein
MMSAQREVQHGPVEQAGGIFRTTNGTTAPGAKGAHNNETMKIPLFPLDVVLFPGAPLPLHIFEERYREMFRRCMAEQIEFGVVRAQEDGLAVVGCTASIGRVMHRYEDGRFDVMCHGERRFEIELLDDTHAYLQAEVDFLQDEGPEATRAEREQCAALHFEAIELARLDLPMPHLDLDKPIAFPLAAVLPAELEFKQHLLDMRSDAGRTRKLQEFYEVLLPQLRANTPKRKATSNGRVM